MYTILFFAFSFLLLAGVEEEQVDRGQNTDRVDDQERNEPRQLVIPAGTPERHAPQDEVNDNEEEYADEELRRTAVGRESEWHHEERWKSQGTVKQKQM